uniref:Uncharacterized protein n=1 Tax=Spironucleus salmonicida TaxID=348837 RepID=V6LLL9_9EUKA|eukprot:EST45580.1 Hypothetical protein SS50377_14422 [Spironucleus salmonicida]
MCSFGENDKRANTSAGSGVKAEYWLRSRTPQFEELIQTTAGQLRGGSGSRTEATGALEASQRQ